MCYYIHTLLTWLRQRLLQHLSSRCSVSSSALSVLNTKLAKCNDDDAGFRLHVLGNLCVNEEKETRGRAPLERAILLSRGEGWRGCSISALE